MRPIYDNILETIGDTPIVKLHHVTPPNSKHEYFVKLEYFNPGLSVKDRIAMALIEGAEKSGKLKPGGTIIEATSGNTGMGLAMVAAVKGYKAIFVMPDKISEEKRAILRAYGAKVVITPTAVEPEDPRSYISVANKLVEITPNSFLTNQYHNPDNPKKHYETTGPEIWKQMGGKIDAFFAGAGTGGTISGVGKYLKEQNPKVQIVCPDPVGSILYDLYYHKKIVDPPKSYKVEGVGEDMLPDNVHLNVMDGFVKVSDQESFQLTRDLVAKEGICVGPSSAMNLAGAFTYAEKNFKEPSRILVLMADSGRSYLSKAFNDEWLSENNFAPSLLKTKKVGDMAKSKSAGDTLVKVDLQMTAAELVRLMKDKKVTRVLVQSNHRIMGMVSEEMLLQNLASGRIRAKEPILHILKDNLIVTEAGESLENLAQKLMGDQVAIFKDDSGKDHILTRNDVLEQFIQSEL